MENVSRIKDKAAQEALELLDQAWSYYSPEPQPKSQVEAPKPALFQYYDAA